MGRDSPTISQGISGSSSEHQQYFPTTGSTATTVTITATITKIDDESGWVSSPKDTVFPETIPEESSSTEEEHVVIFRLPSLQESDGFIRDPSIYTAETSIIQLAMRRNGRTNNVKADHVSTPTSDSKPPSAKPPMQKIGSSTDKDSMDSSKLPSIEDKKEDVGKTATLVHDISAATFLDVAVLRCLFITHWQEDGIYWALHYMYNRLRDISDELAGQQQPRKRSNSLPIPKIEVSLYQSTESKKCDENHKDFIEVPEPKDVSLHAESPFVHSPTKSEESLHKRASSEKIKKKKRGITDLKTFVETKILSKSDKALEKIGQEGEQTPLGQVSECHRSLDTGESHLSRPQSTLSKIFEPPTNLVKGKSMPSLSCILDELNAVGYVDENHWENKRSAKLGHSQPMANPIITVTEHTPTPSPDYLRRQGSMDSQLDAASLCGSKLGNWQERTSSLIRSLTDSNITYTGEDVPEAPGAACYVTKDG
ncbi:unnamed protein product, partial [Phaedon cochleariae]